MSIAKDRRGDDVRRHRAGRVLLDAVDDDGIGFDDDYRRSRRRRLHSSRSIRRRFRQWWRKRPRKCWCPARSSRSARRRAATPRRSARPSLGKQTPPDVNTHFRIASNSKTMTAALVVLLVQDGKLKFTDPVSNYVPDVPNGANITVAELLTMRSGLYNYTNAPEFSAELDANLAKAWTPQEVLAIAFAHPPNAPPDTRPTSTTTPTTRCWG